MNKVTDNNQRLDSLRHSLAHLLAAAVVDLYPEARPTIGPAVENGFYYDFDFGTESLSEDDLPKIEARMREILPMWRTFHRIEVNEDQARKIFDHNPYKLELINEIVSQGEDLTLYYAGPADEPPSAEDIVATMKETRTAQPEEGVVHSVELCRGGHVEDLEKEVDAEAFKLDAVAGAYWRGDENNTMLTRVYGLAFARKDELEDFLGRRELAKQRDHRKLGQEMNLFTFSELVGSGLPLFTPKGTVLRELLGRYSQQLRKERGFESVWIPHFAKKELYKVSGHWDKFKDELLVVNSQETSDTLVMKSMNCPHHAQLYAAHQRSYRDLPVKYMENTTVYRDEKSGELHGLSRVRSITQDDSHVFARPDQVAESVDELVSAAKELYEEIGMELSLRLSFRDESDDYLGDAKLWQKAQSELKAVAEAQNLDYHTEEGEAAFYGPKLDFMAVDVLGRAWQVATVQLDFVQPQRFELEYVGEDGARNTPVMIHAALLGSFERFLSIYIEHTGGRFPFWLAPEQVRILSINDEVLPYIEKITTDLSRVVLDNPVKYNELRYSVDDRNESLGKKIREAETAKIPLIVIIGPKDEEDEVVSIRTSAGEQKIDRNKLSDFIKDMS